MFRSLLPFLLAILGLTMILWARQMPIFEWQISEIVSDLPPAVRINPSPWTTRLGQSLDDDSYVLDQIYVSSDGLPCRVNGVNSIAQRAQNDKALDRVAANIDKKVISLFGWNLVGFVLFLCGGIYVWWFLLWSERPISEAFVSTAIVIVIYVFVAVGIWRHLMVVVVPTHFVCSGISDQYHGTLAFSASLSNREIL